MITCCGVARAGNPTDLEFRDTSGNVIKTISIRSADLVAQALGAALSGETAPGVSAELQKGIVALTLWSYLQGGIPQRFILDSLRLTEPIRKWPHSQVVPLNRTVRKLALTWELQQQARFIANVAQNGLPSPAHLLAEAPVGHVLEHKWKKIAMTKRVPILVDQVGYQSFRDLMTLFNLTTLVDKGALSPDIDIQIRSKLGQEMSRVFLKVVHCLENLKLGGGSHLWKDTLVRLLAESVTQETLDRSLALIEEHLPKVAQGTAQLREGNAAISALKNPPKPRSRVAIGVVTLAQVQLKVPFMGMELVSMGLSGLEASEKSPAWVRNLIPAVNRKVKFATRTVPNSLAAIVDGGIRHYSRGLREGLARRFPVTASPCSLKVLAGAEAPPL